MSTMKKLTDPSQIPSNMSREREAEFWRTHELTKEFFSKLSATPESELPTPRAKLISIRFEGHIIQRLKRLAAGRGTGYQPLLKDFVARQLRAEENSEVNHPLLVDMSNRPVTSREYKLMLNMDRFKDREQASQEFLSLLEFLVEKERGSVVEEQNDEERNEEEERQTSYLDTPERALHQQGFALRLREEDDDKDKFQINLKYRAPDRYISAAQDLSSPQDGKTKFEEDILPPFVSKFSHSTSIETDADPELGTMYKVMDLFPGLRKLDIDENTPVETVNDFKVLEVDRKLCKLKFGEEPIIKASLSFWYLTGEKDKWPLVGEFSFDYDVLDNEADREKLEMYPHRVVEGANRLFHALQKQEGWLSFNTTTKTAFALEGL